MLDNTIIYYKCPTILKKAHCVDPTNEEYVQLLVKIKEILNKIAFSYASLNVGTLLHYLYTIYRSHFWLNFSTSCKKSRQ